MNNISDAEFLDYAEQRFQNKRSKKTGGIAKKARVKAAKIILDATTPRHTFGSSSNSIGLNRRGVASKETGYVDVAPAGYALDTTGTVTLLNTIAQGASVNQRVGKKVVLKSLQIRGQVFNNSAAVNNDVAMLIVYDRRPTGALPAITDILVTANSSAMNNDANSGRFRILKRFDALLQGAPAATLGFGPGYSCDSFLKLRKIPTVYKAAATGAIGDIEEGALYLVTVGDEPASATLAATFSGAFRTRFIDV